MGVYEFESPNDVIECQGCFAPSRLKTHTYKTFKELTGKDTLKVTKIRYAIHFQTYQPPSPLPLPHPPPIQPPIHNPPKPPVHPPSPIHNPSKPPVSPPTQPKTQPKIHATGWIPPSYYVKCYIEIKNADGQWIMVGKIDGWLSYKSASIDISPQDVKQIRFRCESGLITKSKVTIYTKDSPPPDGGNGGISGNKENWWEKIDMDKVIKVGLVILALFVIYELAR